jgi:hypothetical protein
VNYQLIRDSSTSVGSPLAGTGLALNFGNQTVAGVYTVIATNSSVNGCSGGMNGSASISVDQLPTVTLALNFECDDQGGEQVTQLVATANPGASYSYSWTGPDGLPIKDENGIAINAAAITPTKPGTYTVVVTNIATGCSVSGSYKLCFTGDQLVNQAAAATPTQQPQADSSSTVSATSQPTGFRAYLARVFSILG